MQLTDGNTSSDGYLEIFFQGEWYTTCSNPDHNDGDVVCRELGHEGVIDRSRRPRDSDAYTHPLWSNLDCRGTEDSVFDCGSCCNLFVAESYYCGSIPEYSCQSEG